MVRVRSYRSQSPSARGSFCRTRVRERSVPPTSNVRESANTRLAMLSAAWVAAARCRWGLVQHRRTWQALVSRAPHISTALPTPIVRRRGYAPPCRTRRATPVYLAAPGAISTAIWSSFGASATPAWVKYATQRAWKLRHVMTLGPSAMVLASPVRRPGSPAQIRLPSASPPLAA
jgi:hypothetical protein